MNQQALSSRVELIEESALTQHLCPSCGHKGLLPFYKVHNVPVHSCLMFPTKQEALDFPCGDIMLGFCEQCGFITNTAFDPATSKYSPIYEDQQSFSPTFNSFAHKLANRLVEKYDLHDKDIIEIGCSKGDFLIMLCELGHNRGIGIDPSTVVGRVKSEATERVIFIQDYYSERYGHYRGDLICCRHTLEHIHATADFLSTVRRTIGDNLDTVIFFELPETRRVLREQAFWDIYYEHCSYFSPGSLGRLFRHCGFEVIDIALDYDDQYLLLEARPVSKSSEAIHTLEETPEQLAEDVRYFSTHIGDKLAQWKQHLEQVQAQKKRAVIWGSGSKCVSFLTTLGTEDQIEYIVDINPHRHGKFIPGLGKEIMPPEFLKEYKPDQIIVMNPIYCDEIQKSIDGMGVGAELIPV